jgi:two-component sensor histidine kinase
VSSGRFVRLRDGIERLPLAQDRRSLGYAGALALCFVSLGLRLALDSWFPPGFPYLIFFPAVMLSAFLFGRGPGVVAAVLCGLFADFFFIAPFGSLAPTRATAIVMGFYGVVTAIDIAIIHWMQQANAHLRAERERSLALSEERGRLAERTELLFHELQHRVSNNLQTVGALLALQQRAVADGQAREALAQAAARVQLIGRLQRKLYDASGRLAEMESYLCELAADLLAAAGRPGVRAEVGAEGDIRLPAEAAIPVALIAAEAISNALEHGLAGREVGRIEVRVARRGDEVEMSVRDDGRGLPEAFDAERSDSLGLRIVRTLAQQIGGRFALAPAQPGARLSLSFPMKG